MKRYFIWCILFVFLAGCSDKDDVTPPPVIPPEEEPEPTVSFREQDSLALVNLWNTSVWGEDKPDWDFESTITDWSGVVVSDGRVVALDFIGKTLMTLSDGIGRFSVLNSLNVSGNEELIALSDSVWTLSGLTRLDISGTGLETISERISTCHSLSFLKLEGWNGNEFPESVLKCDFLDTLIISPLLGWNGAVIPKQIGDMTGLKYLSFTDMMATDFMMPVSLSNLKQLKTLVLNNVGIDVLPENLRELGNLEELRATFINMAEFPEWLGELSHLKKLSCMACGLEEFPPVDLLTGLEELELAGNYIPELPAEIGQLVKLTRLSVIASRMTDVPDEIGELVSLRELILSANELTRLPETMERLIALELLDLTDNYDLEWEIPASMQVRADAGDLIVKLGEAEDEPGIK